MKCFSRHNRALLELCRQDVDVHRWCGRNERNKIEPKKLPESSKPNGCFQVLTFSVTDIFLESKKIPFWGIFICQIN